MFGKLPSHGDFVCRGMTGAEQAAWDDWLAEGLSAARANLGDRFDEAHGQAPAWNFVSGPGRFGEGWRVGAFAPSADSVGRRFMLVTVLQDLSWGDVVAEASRLATAAMNAIYRALGERLDADRTLALLSSCGPDEGSLGPLFAQLATPLTDGLWWTTGGERHAAAAVLGASPAADLIVRALTPLEDTG